MKLKTVFVSLLSFVCLCSAKAQTFSYSLQKDSSIYTSLTGAQVLSTGENFRNKNFKIALPFQFNFCGTTTDSIFIEGNGFVVFNRQREMAIVSYNSFTSNRDTSQNYSSSILYTTEGTSGNKILKIEFKSLSRTMLSNSDRLNYQIWLYENGNKIEFRTGANSYAVSELPVLIGLINRSMDSEDKAYLITGDSQSLSGELITGENDLVYLNNVPFEGTVLKLTPTF